MPGNPEHAFRGAWATGWWQWLTSPELVNDHTAHLPRIATPREFLLYGYALLSQSHVLGASGLRLVWRS